MVRRVTPSHIATLAIPILLVLALHGSTVVTLPGHTIIQTIRHTVIQHEWLPSPSSVASPAASSTSVTVASGAVHPSVVSSGVEPVTSGTLDPLFSQSLIPLTTNSRWKLLSDIPLNENLDCAGTVIRVADTWTVPSATSCTLSLSLIDQANSSANYQLVQLS